MVVSRVNHKLLHIVKIDGLFDVRLSNVMRIILDKDWQIPSKVGTDSVLIFTDNNKESFILIKLLLVDDHELVRTGIRRILEDVSDFEVVGKPPMVKMR